MAIYWKAQAQDPETGEQRRLLITPLNQHGIEFAVYHAYGKANGWQLEGLPPHLMSNKWILQSCSAAQIPDRIQVLRILQSEVLKADQTVEFNTLEPDVAQPVVDVTISTIKKKVRAGLLDYDPETVRIATPPGIKATTSYCQAAVHINTIIGFLEYCVKMQCGFQVERTTDELSTGGQTQNP